MVLNNKRKEIILGVSNGLQFHELFDTKENFTHYIGTKPISVIKEHTDIVRNISVMDSRIYSTGYDGALIIYDSNFSGNAVKYLKNTRFILLNSTKCKKISSQMFKFLKSP